MSLRNGDSVVNNNGRWRSSLLNTPANGRCYLYTQLTTRPSTVMLWLEPNHCDLSWISCKRVPPVVQQMTRFRLTERIARSVCASRASFEKQTEYGQQNYKWRLPQYTGESRPSFLCSVDGVLPHWATQRTDWQTTLVNWVCPAWPVRRQTYGYLPSRMMSPLFDRYQFILHWVTKARVW